MTSRALSVSALEAHTSPLLARPDKAPLVVCILDGVGVAKASETNAVHLANTPTLDKLFACSERYVTVQAHGKAVGLPSNDDMGNSEVGHNAIGCGRIVSQGAALVDNALESGSIFSGAGWEYISSSFASNTLHLIGLLSDGGVHSRYDQIIKIARGAVERGCKRLRVHVLLDGRDVPDGSSIKFVQQLETELKEFQGCDARVASGGGRMCTTMDRYEADWSIVERGWKAHVLGQAPRSFSSGLEAVTTLRQEDPDVSDQYLTQFTITEGGSPVGTVEDDDAVLFCNFRGDRAIEISRAFTEGTEFDGFDRVRVPKVRYAGLMSYDGDLNIPPNYLVDPPLINETSGEYLAKSGVRTYAISETQKYGHVTYFWNGNKSGYFDEELETYQEIESDRIEFNQKPDMKAQHIADLAVEALGSGKYDFVRLNFANGDMVGHTGDLQASVKAMETVDRELTRVLDAVNQAGGRFLVTADHGNCDEMVQRNKKGEPILDAKTGKPLPLTSHTLAPVPVCIGGAGLAEGVKLKLPEGRGAGLANITATYINLLGLKAPTDYEPTLIDL